MIPEQLGSVIVVVPFAYPPVHDTSTVPKPSLAHIPTAASHVPYPQPMLAGPLMARNVPPVPGPAPRITTPLRGEMPAVNVNDPARILTTHGFVTGAQATPFTCAPLTAAAMVAALTVPDPPGASALQAALLQLGQ